MGTLTCVSTFLQMAKMVPMETRQSMLEEPSKGSKHTMYLPWKRRKSAKNNFISSAKPALWTTNKQTNKQRRYFIQCYSRECIVCSVQYRYQRSKRPQGTFGVRRQLNTGLTSNFIKQLFRQELKPKSFFFLLNHEIKSHEDLKQTSSDWPNWMIPFLKMRSQTNKPSGSKGTLTSLTQLQLTSSLIFLQRSHRPHVPSYLAL